MYKLNELELKCCRLLVVKKESFTKPVIQENTIYYTMKKKLSKVDKGLIISSLEDD